MSSVQNNNKKQSIEDRVCLEQLLFLTSQLPLMATANLAVSTLLFLLFADDVAMAPAMSWLAIVYMPILSDRFTFYFRTKN